MRRDTSEPQSHFGISGWDLMLDGGDITAGPSPFYDVMGTLQEEAYIKIILDQDPDLTPDNFLDKYGAASERVRLAVQEGDLQSLLPEGLDPQTFWEETLESARRFGAEAIAMATERAQDS